MPAKFVCINLAVTFCAANLLNSRLAIYSPWLGISFSTAVRAVVVAKLIILGILFLTSFVLALSVEVVAKLVILVISFLTSFVLELRVVLVAKLVISGILFSIPLILVLYTFF